MATLHKRPRMATVDAPDDRSGSKVDMFRRQKQQNVGARPASTAIVGGPKGPQDPEAGAEKLSRA
jgi:hypothetical protein